MYPEVSSNHIDPLDGSVYEVQCFVPETNDFLEGEVECPPPFVPRRSTDTSSLCVQVLNRYHFFFFPDHVCAARVLCSYQTFARIHCTAMPGACVLGAGIFDNVGDVLSDSLHRLCTEYFHGPHVVGYGKETGSKHPSSAANLRVLGHPLRFGM